MSSRTIPFSAYTDIQSQMEYHASTVDPKTLSEVVAPLGEKRFFSLLNCLVPKPLDRYDLGSHIPNSKNLAEFMLIQIQDTTVRRTDDPLNPKNAIDWERLHQLALKHDDLNAVLKVLLNGDLRMPNALYRGEVVQFRENTTKHLERHVQAHSTFIKCPMQNDWVHEGLFHEQFLVTCLGVDYPQSKDLYHGLIEVALDECSTWLKSQEGRFDVIVRHLSGDPIGYGDYDSGRISWKYTGVDTPTRQYKSFDEASFLVAVNESAKRVGFNHRRKSYLAHSLDI